MPRPRIYDDALRDTLIDNAAEALVSGGVDNLSIRAVAAASETSTNAVYTIFGSKNKLVGAVIERAFQGLARAQWHTCQGLSGWDHLLHLARAYRSWALETPTLYAVIFGMHRSEDVANDLQTAIAPMNAAIADLVAAKQIIDLPVAELSHALWSLVHGFVSVEPMTYAHISRSERDARFERYLDAAATGWRVG